MREDCDESRFADMLGAARQALEYAEDRRREDLDTNSMLRDAILRQIEVLGEAARGVSEGGRNSLSSLPWREIIAMRNHLIHAYSEIDLDLVWQTVVEDLPFLRDELTRRLASF